MSEHGSPPIAAAPPLRRRYANDLLATSAVGAGAFRDRTRGAAGPFDPDHVPGSRSGSPRSASAFGNLPAQRMPLRSGRGRPLPLTSLVGLVLMYTARARHPSSPANC